MASLSIRSTKRLPGTASRILSLTPQVGTTPMPLCIGRSISVMSGSFFLTPRILVDRSADCFVDYIPSRRHRAIGIDSIASRWHSSQGNYSSQQRTAEKKKSPYSILQVKVNATKEEIKSSFRKLAKLHHPDMKNQYTETDLHCQSNEGNMMTEIINAYEFLMNKHGDDPIWNNLSDHSRDSRVALACEMYTIEELRSAYNCWYDVYSFRVRYSDDGEISAHDEGNQEGGQKSCNNPIEEKMPSHQRDIDAYPIISLVAHPEDSISDLKRDIQSQFASSWGLEGRRVDRDGIYLGWELVFSEKGNVRELRAAQDTEHDGNVLSYHLFLHSYNIREGDILHAVVRRYI